MMRPGIGLVRTRDFVPVLVKRDRPETIGRTQNDSKVPVFLNTWHKALGDG